ncbi:MAG: DUF192 domain-containing protein [Candidatus Omnitrophota bacterium]
MRIINRTRGTVLADKAKNACTFASRLVGLLNCSSLGPGEALILTPSNAIHSFFMRFSFDALFLDKKNEVIALIPIFKPFRLSPMFFNAVTTIELPCGSIKSSQTEINDKIEIAA